MDIAIAAPSPVPFAMGGAESLFLSLQRFINESTPHHCELIKLPSPEADFHSLVASYEAFSELDLSHFDLVITTKYPAWMVRHPRQTVYLQHRLRGLYDTYHLTGLPLTAAPSPGIETLRAKMHQLAMDSRAHARLPEFFDALRAVIVKEPELLRFPGPFAREVIHFLDRVGLAPARVRSYAAISENVRQRKDYFPEGHPVRVCHHPSGLKGLRQGADEYLFTASRLDGPKRIGLIIEAMRYVKADIPLLIAGTGPDEEKLKEIAADDPRIQFLGFVNDDELVNLYADALAVLYLPFDEDFGLVTIEAMMSSKPVVTTTDAGGVNEFVKDGQTGYSVPPKPKAIANRIDHLCRNRAESKRMGAAGREIARQITWDRVVDTLLHPRGGSNVRTVNARSNRRDRLVVSTTFPIYPPRGGGQARIFNLYREIARNRDVEIVSLAASNQPEVKQEIAPGLFEIRVAKSPEHEAEEQALSRRVGNTPVTDVAMPLLHALTPEYGRELSRAVQSAHAVIASHPYSVSAIRSASADAPLWYEAHNVEIELKRQILGRYPATDRLLAATERVERECWRASELVYACSADDLDVLAERYGSTDARQLVVANGVDLETTSFFPPAERIRLKKRFGLDGLPVALFLGSWHQPNIEAVEFLLECARSLPDVVFLIVGSVGGPFEYVIHPDNVVVTGVVEAEEKRLLLGCADLALNPMASGSGTNLKMLDYFAAGAPVLSTPLGARGIEVEPDENVFIAELEEFSSRLRQLLSSDDNGLPEVAAAARNLVEREYSWPVIAKRFEKALDSSPDEIVAELPV